MASGIDISRSSVPDVRSRSIAIEVTRNIETNRKMPTSGAPIRSERLLLSVEDVLHDRRRGGGTRMTSASVRWSWRSCRRTRPAVASVIRGVMTPPRRRGRLLRGRRYVGLLGSSDGEPVRDSSVAKKDKVVAPLCLVHDVAGDEQCRAAGEQLVEHVPEIAPEDEGRGRPWARRGRAGRCPSSCRERDARRLAARGVRTIWFAWPPRSTASIASFTRPLDAPRMAAKYSRFWRTVRSK